MDMYMYIYIYIYIYHISLSLSIHIYKEASICPDMLYMVLCEDCTVEHKYFVASVHVTPVVRALSQTLATGAAKA